MDNTKKINRQLTDTQRVPPSAMGRYVNLETGNFQMRGLIEDILRAKGAIWVGGVNTPSERAEAIAVSMYTEEILEAARNTFTIGTIQYPPSSLHTCLNDRMLKHGEVGRIQLSPGEDGQRRSARPRCKWYWALA